VAALQDTVQQQADALVASTAQIRALEQKLARAYEMTWEAEGSNPVQGGQEASIQQLEEEAGELRAQVQERDQEYRGLKVQLEATMRLADELQGAHPDVKRAVSEAVAGERAAQEVRNRKVLELLGQKDESIQLMEARHNWLEQEAAGLRVQAQAMEEELSARNEDIKRLEKVSIFRACG
jgi:chromosome segregation ATPase